MRRLAVLAFLGMVLMFAGLFLITSSSIAFAVGGGRNLVGLLPYIAPALVFGGAGAGLLVASLRLPLPKTRTMLG